MKWIRRKLASTVKVVSKREKFARRKCASCGKNLQGTLSMSVTKMKNIAKTKKQPSRKFGGYLCNRCSREEIIKEARK